jgi:hypothetical protein
MTGQRIVLTDAEANLHIERGEWRASPDLSLAGAADWFVRTYPLHGGQSEGVQVVEVCNGPLTLFVLPTRGMGVWKGRFRSLPLGWKSPVPRPVHPHYVNLHDRNGLGWLNGFNELMCRCGLAFNGPPGQDGSTAVTLHGRIANLPAHFVEVRIEPDGAGWIELRGIVDETSMLGPCLRLTSTLRLKAGSAICHLIDEITNLGGTATELSLLYHINIGRPFLEAGAATVIAHRAVAPRDPRSAEGVADLPRYEGPTPGFAEQAYYYLPVAGACGWSTALLKNAAGTAGFAVHYQTLQLPCLTIWKNTQDERDGYVTGIEPGVNFPNFRAYERARGRLPRLEPGQTYRAEQMWEFADSAEGVAALCESVRLAQRFAVPVRHSTPMPGWSPAGEAVA